MLTDIIKQCSSDILKEMILIRRKVHQHPELGFKEFETSSLISGYLENLGLKVTKGIGGTGVVGLLEGATSGSTIAIRADMDALPISEENDLPYASANKGIMHACGHDVHISIALGVAHILSKNRNKIKGNVKFIFQPAEEGLGGAKVMIDEGVLSNPDVDAIIALHVSPLFKSGQISISPGPVMASPAEFEIEITGRGGHAAQPQKTVDPIVISSNIINLFQTIVSRNVDPLKSAVISVTSFHAGNTFNIIPSNATLKGTVRAFDPLLHKEISEKMEAIISSVAGGMGANYTFNYNLNYPPVVNSKEMVDIILKASSKIIPEENIIQNNQASMLAEDFSYFLNKVPGAMFNLGCTHPDAEHFENLHSSKFNVDESCILTGMEIFARTVFDYLNK